ncbi:MAG: exo-alpha-sialidase [Chitinophagia bacterium]|jgi:sialidase-1|nr:exo-alpha-sialidase [Chitinophagia bacterium]
MKKITLLLLAILTQINFCISQNKKVSVFISGTEGYKSFRIPAIIKTFNNDLLAFCEGRVNSSGDFGDIDIVMKRSTDHGKTWTSISKVVNYDLLQAGNPAPVIDNTDPAYPNGRIFLFYNTGNNHEGEIRKGKGVREVWYKTSIDNGFTWSEGVNITTQTHRPNYPQVSSTYNFKEDWRSYANTPGHGLQILEGIYRGRIFIAANHSSGAPLPNFMDYNAHAYYSDDHGKSFKLSETVNVPGSNESTAAEISNNRVMLNARNQSGHIKARLAVIGSNGGANWDTSYFDNQLPDPVCEGSILNIGTKNKKNILAFSNAADTLRRDNLTLRISFDEGKTWPKRIPIDKSSVEGAKDFTAYSDLVKMNNNQIGVLYEKEGYAKIEFIVINWKK